MERIGSAEIAEIMNRINDELEETGYEAIGYDNTGMFLKIIIDRRAKWMDFGKFVTKKMEEKLIELMGQEGYEKFATEIAREGFQKEIDGMADGEFKDFIKDNIDEITK